MANKILVLGSSGTGKTTSIRNLDPKNTIVVQGRKKRLPFKKDKEYIEGKNRFVLDSNTKLLKLLEAIEKGKADKMVLVVDDWNYLMTSEYMAARNEKGFTKFERMAFNLIDVLDYVDNMTKDITVIFMAHTQKDNDGELEFKSVGKFVSEKFCLEGAFETVFLATEEHEFVTNGIIPAKTPIDMFENEEVENDLKEILEVYNKFYE